jgi:hypothetical protein
VQSLYQNVYQRRSPARQLPVGELLDEKYELFQLNLIFALANIDPYRKGQSDKHPFGYFTAGLQNLNGVMSFETIRDVQGFLLIAHFGLYYYIGTYPASLFDTLADHYSRLFHLGNLSNLSANLH